MLNSSINNLTFENNLKLLKNIKYFNLLKQIKRGFEKETLRADENGRISLTKHPVCFGSSLMHPSITTDFSEALLEFITPPSQNLVDPLQKLTEIHQAVYHCLKNEFLWHSSMPCLLPAENDIPIASFGHSNLGQLRKLYRQGLGFRYGKAMQTIAGIHYNFSLSNAFFQQYYQDKNHEQVEKHTQNNHKELALKDFISEQYLGLIRNTLRYSFILPLLFGASPAVSQNFLNLRHVNLNLENIGHETFIAPYATSLRLSDLGYHNTLRTIYEISYNSFPEFLKTMQHAIHTKDPDFAKIGIYVDGEYKQLNDTIFQLENEHYSLIRPKRIIKPEERTLAALQREGIEYLEIRALDLNPYSLLGVDQKTMLTLDIFLLTCFFLDSPAILKDERTQIHKNLQLITFQGRKPGLKIWTDNEEMVELDKYIEPFLKQMQKMATLLDRVYEIEDFSSAIQDAMKRLKNKDLLPSAEIVNDLKTKKLSYINFIKILSLKHKKEIMDLTFSQELIKYYERLAKESLNAQTVLEKDENKPFSEYLNNFLNI